MSSGAGHRGFSDDLGNQVVGGDFFSLGFVGHPHAVAQHVGGDFLNQAGRSTFVDVFNDQLPSAVEGSLRPLDDPTRGG